MRFHHCFSMLYAPDGVAGAGPGASALQGAVDYDRLRDLLASLEDGLREVIDTYLEDSPCLIQSLRDACAGGDWPEVQRMAHSLKSSSGIFGAQKMVAACKALEAAAGEQPSLRCLALIDEAEIEYKRVEGALTEFIHRQA